MRLEVLSKCLRLQCGWGWPEPPGLRVLWDLQGSTSGYPEKHMVLVVSEPSDRTGDRTNCLPSKYLNPWTIFLDGTHNISNECEITLVNTNTNFKSSILPFVQKAKMYLSYYNITHRAFLFVCFWLAFGSCSVVLRGYSWHAHHSCSVQGTMQYWGGPTQTSYMWCLPLQPLELPLQSHEIVQRFLLMTGFWREWMNIIVFIVHCWKKFFVKQELSFK